jgi:hypothetical protein
MESRQLNQLDKVNKNTDEDYIDDIEINVDENKSE